MRQLCAIRYYVKCKTFTPHRLRLYRAKRTSCLSCSCPRRTPHDYCARRRTLHSFALCCSALGLLDSTNAMSSTAANIGPSRWFLMLRPHCVPPLPEPETARRALLLHGAVIAFTLAATTAQRRLNEHKFCSAFYLCNHASAGTFTDADSAAFHAGAGHFSEQEKAGRRLHRSPGFKSLFPPRSGT